MKEKLSLEEIKIIELQILKEFASYCEENHLKYVLAYGTLLGAVRHGGFIPWDDDIDVLMPREDYEKFYKLLQVKPLNAQYKVVSWKDKTAIYPFFKIIDNNTEVIETYIKNKTGIWIDIFPVDKLCMNDRKNNKLFRRIDRMRSMHRKAIARPFVGMNLKKKILRTIGYPITLILNPYKIANKIDIMAQEFNKSDSTKGLVDFVWGINLRYLPKDLFEFELMEFEGIEFRVPKKYDEVLKMCYGDYMKLPPKEKRVGHTMEAKLK